MALPEAKKAHLDGEENFFKFWSYLPGCAPLSKWLDGRPLSEALNTTADRGQTLPGACISLRSVASHQRERMLS